MIQTVLLVVLIHVIIRAPKGRALVKISLNFLRRDTPNCGSRCFTVGIAPYDKLESGQSQQEVKKSVDISFV